MSISRRSFRQVDFGSADEVVILEMPEGGAMGQFDVYGRLTGTEGSATITVSGAFLDDPGTTPVAEIQTVTLTDGPASGTFKLTYSGQQTAAIDYNAAGSAVKTALEDLSNIGSGDLTVTRTGSGTALAPYVWTITFGGSLIGTNVAQLTGQDVDLEALKNTITIATSLQGYTLNDLIALETDFALTDAIQLIEHNEAVYPYLVLNYNGTLGGGESDLSAEVYITAY